MGCQIGTERTPAADESRRGPSRSRPCEGSAPPPARARRRERPSPRAAADGWAVRSERNELQLLTKAAEGLHDPARVRVQRLRQHERDEENDPARERRQTDGLSDLNGTNSSC